MLESVESIATKHKERMDKIKSQIEESDRKIDGVIEVKLSATREEERHKAERRNNVRIFGILESEEKESSKRTEHDKLIMNEILDTLLLDKATAKKLIRISKPTGPQEGRSDNKSRPMKVIFDEEQTKNELLKRAKN
jgi:hypothetical protein